MMKKDTRLTNAPSNSEVTIQTGDAPPNKKHTPGDSVAEHKDQEMANLMIAENEIGQQNENL
ncbi:hypothetical protein [Bacillus massilinigeriensis]|uniref:hypothetical protein n=1 Tax=Bacillus mediterraneensis TaxID=1805474 RepID=UPI0008F8F230|nr:hypothetical protein [Bacillus mediterraneensis]